MSRHKVDTISESSPGVGVTIEDLKAPGFVSSIPVFNTQAARDAFYPVPAGDEVAQRTDTGYVERYDTGAGEWRREGVTRTAGPIVSAFAKGAKGTGAADDRGALALMDAALATGGRGELDPGVYRVDANITLSNHFHPLRGSWLKPNAGVQIIIAGVFDPGDYPVFDLSLGGTVLFLLPYVTFNPRWWDVKGNNLVDEQPALTRMVNSIPNYATALFVGGMILRLDSLWAITARRGLTFLGAVLPFPDGTNAVQFRWNGVAGGTMIKSSSCDSVMFQRLYGNLGANAPGTYANVFIALEDTGINGVTGSQNSVIECLGNATATPSLVFDFVTISVGGADNQEYHRVIRCRFYGNGTMLGPTQGISATIAAGSLNVVTINGIGTLGPVGTVHRVQIAGAGVAGAPLDTTVTTTAPTVGTLAIAASGAVANVFVLVGQANGRGVNIGPNSNSKGQYIFDNYFINLYRGIYQQNGSSYLHKNNFSACCSDIELLNGTEPFEDHYSNTEQSWQHLIIGVNFGQPLIFGSARWGNLHCAPGKGWLQFYGGASISVRNCEFDDRPSIPGRGANTRSTAYDFANFSGSFEGVGNRYGNSWSPQEVGYLDANGRPVSLNSYKIESSGETGILGMPAQVCFFGTTMLVTKADVAGAFIAEVRTGGGVLPKHIGAIARAIIGAQGSNTGDVLVAHQATFGKDAGGGVRFDRNFRCYEALLPIQNTDGYTALEMTGFRVISPIITGGGASPATGLHVEDLQSGGTGSLGATKAINQIGLADTNTLNGDTQLGSGLVEKATVYIDIAGGGAATPNSAGAMIYRYRMAGAATINKPTNLLHGRRVKIIMFNNTGGAVAPVLNAAFLGSGYGAIGAAKSRSREFVYDSATDKLEPIGAVSEDF